MSQDLNDWGKVAIVVGGYLLGIFFQTKRLDHFRTDLYGYLDAKFKAVEDRLAKLETTKLVK